MVNENLEQDLLKYQKTRRQKIFNERIYQPLCQLTKWLCSKKYSNITNKDYQDIEQLVMIRVIKGIHYYKPDKGMTIISFVRLLIGQEISKQRKLIESVSNKTIAYDIDKDKRTTNGNTNKITEDYQLLLRQHLLTLKNKEHKKIVRVIIKEMKEKKTEDMLWPERLTYFAKKSKQSYSMVKRVVRRIRLGRLTD